jgi:hypothetical protein
LILERTREGLASGAPKAVYLAGQRIHWGIAAGWKKGGDIRSLLQKVGLKKLSQDCCANKYCYSFAFIFDI